MSDLLPLMVDEVTPLVDAPLIVSSAVDYSGRTNVLATKPGKLDQIAPSMRSALGMELVKVRIDIDAIGMFSVEITRPLSDLDFAIVKARLAMADRVSDLGIASVGTFSPHPDVPWLTTDTEHFVLVDERLDQGCWSCRLQIERFVGETEADPGMCDRCIP